MDGCYLNVCNIYAIRSFLNIFELSFSQMFLTMLKLRKICNFIQCNNEFHLAACHYNFQERFREWGRKSHPTDFLWQWGLFNNEDNSHGPTKVHYVIKLIEITSAAEISAYFVFKPAISDNFGHFRAVETSCKHKIMNLAYLLIYTASRHGMMLALIWNCVSERTLSLLSIVF